MMMMMSGRKKSRSLWALGSTLTMDTRMEAEVVGVEEEGCGTCLLERPEADEPTEMTKGPRIRLILGFGRTVWASGHTGRVRCVG